ncbi:hypothetical protein BJ165DRAFT_1528891 [Panaeolus papilionaceus]|nr:hypothetical protein BJ165DRAFT_1528891 [Panaeolus papilionaceus]
MVGPVKELRSEGLPWDTSSDIMDLGWNIILEDRKELVDDPSFVNGALNLTKDILKYNDPQTFHDAVKITSLWDRGTLDQQPPCVHQPGEAKNLPYMVGRGMYPLNQFISVRCPSRPSRPGFGGIVTAFDHIPDLLIQINYTSLGIASYTNSNQWSNVVQVFAGLLVELNWLFRETYNSAVTSSLGVLDSSRTFAIAEIIQILPDPLTSTTEFSPVQRVEHTSTVRLFTTVSPGDVRILQDSREKSVLAGFSSVGESKPLSIFGFVHGWRKQKLAEKYSKTYPELQSDISFPRREGLMAYLQDYFIDLDPLFLNGTSNNDANLNKSLHQTGYGPSSVDLGKSMHGAAEQGSFISIGGMPGASTSKIVHPLAGRAKEHIPLTPKRFQ